MIIINKRKLKVLFSKSGSGSTNTKVSLPITWLKEMGITEEEREITAEHTGDSIIIKKAERGV